MINFFNRKNKTKTIYIHIGFMKTGTSAIQKFINNNKDFLRKNDFLYPIVNEKAMNYLAFSILDKVPSYIHHKLKDSSEVIYKELVKEISKSDCKNIIISSEAFYLISTNLFLGKEAPYKLYELLGGEKFNFKIISYLRRQDEYVETQYNQYIKTHNFYNLYSDDILKFYNEKKDLFDFNTILKSWEGVYGLENMIVNTYDKNSDVVDSFLKILNLNLKDVSYSKQKINKKLTAKGLDFMKIANKFGVNKSTAYQNYLLVDIVESNLESNRKYDLLTKEECSTIMKEFEKGNIELTDRYKLLNKEWFTAKLEKPNKITSKNVTVEESIKIAVDIWNHFQNK